jgi:DNA-binding Lrp family transcriptional regulator
LDATDRQLLNLVQEAFPLSRRPYLDLARQLGLTEEEVLFRLRRLKEAGSIRRIGPVLDLQAMGYAGTLCALRAPEERLPEIAGAINSFPGVTHNYRRDHEQYNLWFTLTAPSRDELLRTLNEIRRQTGVEEILELPTVRRFKIRLRFDVEAAQTAAGTGDSEDRSRETAVFGPETPEGGRSLSEAEKEIVRLLQDDLALEAKPFLAAARRLGLTEEKLLTCLRNLQERGILRRLGVIINPRNIGLTANAMVVWQVPEPEVDAAGRRLAALPTVTHCYRRCPAPNWPYNLYAVIHGPTREECERQARELARSVGTRYPCRLLFSTTEFKKDRPRHL